MTSRLLHEVLPGVSRSFSLSLRVLPGSLRAPLGITYLVARTADTIADTRALPPVARRGWLEALRAALVDGPGPDLADLPPGEAADGPEPERRLLARLPEVLAAYRSLGAGDRARAAHVLLTLTGAMLEVLARFPAETEGRLGALETRADLDRYTYGNAGCVGAFWTDTVAAHRPRCAGWDLDRMRTRGVQFGQGLQLINVLRDLPRDLAIGRCFLPRAELAALGLAPEDLGAPGGGRRLRPLVVALFDQALHHLEAAAAYLLAVPPAEVRLRLACAWPLLIGLATLAQLRREADRLLDPTVVVKIRRPAVRRLLVGSMLRVTSNRALGGYVRRLAAAAG